MHDPLISIVLDRQLQVHQPGETLRGEYQIDAIDPTEIRAVELSILWYTEGKGEEDLAVHYFERLTAEDAESVALHELRRFQTDLPNSPLSYEGVLGENSLVRAGASVPSQWQGIRRGTAVSTGRNSLCPGGAGMSAVAAPCLPPKFARRSNPFSTRYVRPGAIPFVFPQGCDAFSLIARWQSHGRRGAIVGPHGSGKSTLLAALSPALEQTGERVMRINLHDGQRRLPHDVFDVVKAQEASAIVVDGYEQLSWLSRRWVIAFCTKNQLGLLVTCHCEVQLPVLFRTAVDASLAERIVAGLMPQIEPEITSDDVCRVCRMHGENLREALFALYDLYELSAMPTALRGHDDQRTCPRKAVGMAPAP